MESQQHAPASQARPTVFQIEAASATHIGRRNTNADAALLDDVAGFYAVADGIGDTPRSFLVAQMALEGVRELFLTPWASYPRTRRTVVEAGGRLLLGVEQAHRRLYAPWTARAARIGATFAGVVVCGDQLCVGHLGDSRVYLLRASGGWLAQLTEDHTVAGEARRRGMPREEVLFLPDADKLTQVIGVRSVVDLLPIGRRWEPGDMVLLCTDGVSNCLESDVIVSILLDAANVGTAAQTLVDRAVETGFDNATAVVLRRKS